MPIWMRALMILSFVIVSPKALGAADICVSSPENMEAARRAIAEIQALAAPDAGAQLPLQEVQGIYPLDEYLAKRQKSPFGKDIPRSFDNRFPNIPNMPGMKAVQPEEKRFSWWGYRHQELHDNGVVAELLDKSKPTNCCNGTDSGECRVTRYVTDGVGRRKVLIDDLICDLADDTKIVQLDTFKEQDTIVVCAGKTSAGNYKEERRSCPKAYCIGGGRMGT